MGLSVLQLGKHYPPDIGGIESVIFNLAEGLNAIGVKCDVLCSNTINKDREDNFGDYKVIRTSCLWKTFSCSISPGLISKLKEIQSRYDVITVHLPDPMANLAVFFARPKAKIVVWWHSDIVRQKFLMPFYEPLQNWLIKRADLVIGATDPHIKDSDYAELFKNKFAIVPFGIGVENLNSKLVDVKLLEVLKLRYASRKIIFSLGRLVYYKGFNVLVDAARFLPDDYVVLIGGEGDLEKALRKQIELNGLQKKVVLIGKIPQEELSTYYNFCDVFCLSSVSRAEMFGIVQLEAMSFGKPIISSRIPRSGVSCVNIDGETGFRVSPDSPEELASAIKKICGDKKLHAEMSAACLERFQKYHSREKMAKNVLEEYKKLFLQK